MNVSLVAVALQGDMKSAMSPVPPDTAHTKEERPLSGHCKRAKTVTVEAPALAPSTSATLSPLQSRKLRQCPLAATGLD